ncbi:hypothetical protein KP509_33G044100 [Ceratopteris richardii]|uniref:Uncharacterized protein n=1 Tax=Ceratopteris richardii TaxID=49495 RepID=A0A8T2QQ84_CERRI|nr:hypothetical protein KP509_33G044100 [Ceratopteris richardii]
MRRKSKARQAAAAMAPCFVEPMLNMPIGLSCIEDKGLSHASTCVQVGVASDSTIIFGFPL